MQNVANVSFLAVMAAVIISFYKKQNKTERPQKILLFFTFSVLIIFFSF